MLKIKAPGKLILSGEHAVVHGHPALVMAVNRYVELEITSHTSSDIFFNLADLNYQQLLSLNSVEQLYLKVKKNYLLFKENTLGVKSILETPPELALFTLGILLQNYSNQFSSGIKIKVKSSIPLSSGMGSSAALIVGILFAIGNHLQLNIPLETYYSMALEAENMQHGASSGIDLLASLQGGCLYRQASTSHRNGFSKKDCLHQQETTPNENNFSEINYQNSQSADFSKCGVPFPISMYLVNTGIPQSSTGECVTSVANHFKNSRIGDDFAALTNELYSLLLQIQDMPSLFAQPVASNNLKNIIQANHQLLHAIGVVPDKITRFIKEIENHNGAAKICGAGSINGDKAGMVLVFLEDEAVLKKINSHYKFDILPIEMESRGVHVV